jgi:hypothetical protein
MMKKTIRILTLSLMLALFLPFASLQSQTFDQGDMVLSFGLGLGSTYVGGWNSYYKTTVPPVVVAGDYCLRKILAGKSWRRWNLAYSAYKYHYNTAHMITAGNIPRLSLVHGVVTISLTW